MMGRLLDLDEFLDPKSLTPQELYTLQSETWVQGAEAERERIIELLEARSDCGIEHAYNGTCFCEEIALIKGEQK
jgi:hypothetical protein